LGFNWWVGWGGWLGCFGGLLRPVLSRMRNSGNRRKNLVRGIGTKGRKILRERLTGRLITQEGHSSLF